MRFQMLMPASVSIGVSHYDEIIFLLHIKTPSIYMHYVTAFSIVGWGYRSESWGDPDLQSRPLSFALDELHGALANLWWRVAVVDGTAAAPSAPAMSGGPSVVSFV